MTKNNQDEYLLNLFKEIELKIEEEKKRLSIKYVPWQFILYLLPALYIMNNEHMYKTIYKDDEYLNLYSFLRKSYNRSSYAINSKFYKLIKKLK